MSRFIDGEPRSQSALFPERLEDWIAEDNPVGAVDAFVEEFDLAQLGIERAESADTGRPAYHPGDLLKIHIYGYLNRIPASRWRTLPARGPTRDILALDQYGRARLASKPR
jgi:transposase